MVMDSAGLSLEFFYLLALVAGVELLLRKSSFMRRLTAVGLLLGILLTHLGALNPLMGSGQMSMERPCCMAQLGSVQPKPVPEQISFEFLPYELPASRTLQATVSRPSNKSPPTFE